MKPFKRYPVETFNVKLMFDLNDDGEDRTLTMPKKRTIKVDGIEYYHIATVYDGKRGKEYYRYVRKDNLP